MSTLESKAKTRLDLQLEDEFDSGYKKVCPEMAPVLEEKWVPLADAQLVETELALYKTPDKELAEKIDPAVFANKLVAFGWQDTCFSTKNVLIIQFIKGDQLKHQANIPVSRSLGDYNFAMQNAAKEMAAFLHLEVKQVLVNLVLATNQTCFTSRGIQA